MRPQSEPAAIEVAPDSEDDDDMGRGLGAGLTILIGVLIAVVVFGAAFWSLPCPSGTSPTAPTLGRTVWRNGTTVVSRRSRISSSHRAAASC